MSRPQARLGRGMNALIGPRGARSNSLHVADGTPASAIRTIRLDEIRPNPRQPRAEFSQAALEELAQSIRSNGVVQPILVRPAAVGGYELIAGERRWRAALIAELETIPAIVRNASDSESLELALIENLQREDLTPLDRAAAYQQYLDTFNAAPDVLADRLGESRSSISNYLRLLKLQPEIQALLRSGQLGMGQARAIAGILDPQRQLAVARLAVRRNLSVRQVEDLAKAPADKPVSRETGLSQDRHIANMEKSLARASGLMVRIQPGRKKNAGRVLIYYNSLEEFDVIAERLGGGTNVE